MVELKDRSVLVTAEQNCYGHDSDDVMQNFEMHAIRADLDRSEAEVLSEMKSSDELIGFKQIELGS